MRYVLTLLCGLLIGGALVFFLFVGAPRAHKMTGSPAKAPDPGGDPPGTAVITLDEKFFDAVLATIFNDLGKPTFPLQITSLGGEPEGQGLFRHAALQGGCQNAVTVISEGSGQRTDVQLAEGKILVPLVFTGSYEIPLMGCKELNGWARANIEIYFDKAQQVIKGRITVEGVDLNNFPTLLSGVVTKVVQDAINDRGNPLPIINTSQLALAVPIQASNGTLRAQVNDVRSEVVNGTLRLHITYSFSAEKQG